MVRAGSTAAEYSSKQIQKQKKRLGKLFKDELKYKSDHQKIPSGKYTHKNSRLNNIESNTTKPNDGKVNESEPQKPSGSGKICWNLEAISNPTSSKLSQIITNNSGGAKKKAAKAPKNKNKNDSKSANKSSKKGNSSLTNSYDDCAVMDTKPMNTNKITKITDKKKKTKKLLQAVRKNTESFHNKPKKNSKISQTTVMMASKPLKLSKKTDTLNISPDQTVKKTKPILSTKNTSKGKKLPKESSLKNKMTKPKSVLVIDTELVTESPKLKKRNGKHKKPKEAICENDVLCCTQPTEPDTAISANSPVSCSEKSTRTTATNGSDKSYNSRKYNFRKRVHVLEESDSLDDISSLENDPDYNPVKKSKKESENKVLTLNGKAECPKMDNELVPFNEVYNLDKPFTETHDCFNSNDLESYEESTDTFSTLTTDESCSYSSDPTYTAGSEDDHDYIIPEKHEDLYIPKGVATIHDATDYDVAFDSDCSDAQIIEVPHNYNSGQVELGNEIDNESTKSDDTCPQLIPISYESDRTQDTENMDYDSYSDFDNDTDSYSDSDITEGSLYREIKFNEPLESRIMKPEIFKISNDSVPVNKILSNELVQDQMNAAFDNPLDKIKNINGMTTDQTSYKICTIDGLMDTNTTLNQVIQSPVESIEIIPSNNKFYNANGSHHVLALLKNPIFLYGTIQLTLIAGKVEVFGYQPEIDETIEIFSPRGYCSLDMKPVKSKKYNNLQTEFLEKHITIFTKGYLKEIINLFDPRKDAVVLLKRNDCDKNKIMLSKFMQGNLFPNKNSIDLERPLFSTEYLLECLFLTEPMNPIRIDPKWKTIKLIQKSKLLVIGGKGVGKSTLIRYIVNQNMQQYKKMVVIDLDIGQSELFLPQTISVFVLDRPLLGPGYFQRLQPFKSLIFGDINPVLSPTNYHKITEELLKYCEEQNELKDLPWIINTMGYVKGFGCELIAKIINRLKPTDIIQLQSSKSINNFDYYMFPTVVNTIPMNLFAPDICISELKHRLILFDSVMNGVHFKQSPESSLKAKDMRYAMVMARLSVALGKKDYLTEVTPFCATADDFEIITFGADAFSVALEKNMLLRVINGNLVYLCNKNNETVHCYGIGFVRAVNMEKRLVYLLPAMSHELLREINCIAICNIPLPASVLLNQGPQICGNVPYVSSTIEFNTSKCVNQQPYRGQRNTFFRENNRQWVADSI